MEKSKVVTDFDHQKFSEAQNLKRNDKKGFYKLIGSALLALIAMWAVFSILIIEIKGRRLLKTREEWAVLIKEHPYERKETDLRSPCPMVNTLANHGFIARDGRNIKSDDFFNALMLMGVPPTVTVGILALVYTQLKEADPHQSFISQFGLMPSLDLDRLTVFGVLEHDVSLTRNDSTETPYNTAHPIPELVQRMVRLSELKNNNTATAGLFTRKNENDYRRLRWLESAAHNRYLHLSLFSQYASSTECSLLLDIIGRKGSIKNDHLQKFLLDEQFPEDWHPRETTYSYFDLATKPLICWTGLRRSKVELSLAKELQ